MPGSPTSVTLEAIAELLHVELNPIKQSIHRLEQNMHRLEQNMHRLDQRTGILVEEKARAKARALFGINFSKRLLIKSIYEVVKHIAKADHEMLPAENGDLHVHAAVVKVAGVAQQAADTFVRSAFLNLKAAVADEAFNRDEFTDCKQELTNLEELLSRENPPFSSICGKMLGIVRKLGNVSRIGEEKEEDKEKRVKMTTGTFKRKLERLKVGFANGVDGDNVINFTNCSGPGIMICCELSHIPNQSQPSTSNIRHISKWKEEVECDIRGSVTLIGKSATISTGEIKSSPTEYASAVTQISLRVALIEYILQRAFEKEENNVEEKDRFTSVIKKGHVFVLEKDDSDQRGDRVEAGDVSIFYHGTDLGED